MRIDESGALHLTYCSNIHPGESWPEVRENLERRVVAVKRKLGRPGSFGVGLRLGARAATALEEESARDELKHILGGHDLYVFTINGFPYGAFHGQPVKERVYEPDWRQEERVAYTRTLADILVDVLPDGVSGSISTLPGAFRGASTDARAHIAANIARCGRDLAALADRTGKHVMLALEPEPRCMLETTKEAIEFFERELFPLDDAVLREHVGICFDTCHAAVEFEEPRASLDAIAGAGIAIAKIQLSSGLRVAKMDDAMCAALAPFDEPVYLHQVVERRDGVLLRYLDLPQAVAAWREAGKPSSEWRIHFHVPIFALHLGPFEGTQPFLAEVIAHARTLSRHFEVETYTWDVLPEEHRAGDMTDAIARELDWVLEQP